jgi:hypothetical protein
VQIRRRSSFTSVRTEGAILPPDLLQRVQGGDSGIGGLQPSDFLLQPGERLNEVISRSWNRLQAAWANFQTAARRLGEQDPGTTLTRQRLLLPLFQELGYGRLATATAINLDGRAYPVSHAWGQVPIHLVGFRIELDRRTPGVAGAARSSPHSMLQELLNRSDDHLWAFLANGLSLRILRDNVSLVRQAYVEFDLEAMFEGEAYADFALLWLLCHQSRVEGEKPGEFWLERWSQLAQEQGARALDQLREGVEQAIRGLGQGFLSHRANDALRKELKSGVLSSQDYYRQLLRLVYRLIFLFVAEDRDLLLLPEADENARERYRRYYSTAGLRRLAERLRGGRHVDPFEALKLVMHKLNQEGGCPELALPELGSFLWSEAAIPDLERCMIANQDLLKAVRSLAFTVDGGVRRPVDYRNLGPEELGSVYEALLELQPELNADAGTFELKVVGGSERKTTGSYYTPASLISELLDSALEPIIQEALRQEDAQAALLGLKVCDPACGSGHFLIAAAHRIAQRLAEARTGDPEPAPEATRAALRDVISHCIYGVDVNPMAVELCKVNLWLESLDPGRPLSFLDHRIQIGNSLLGATPALIEAGIPDAAFKPIEGDEKKFASSLKKQNRQERSGQMSMFERLAAERRATYSTLAASIGELEAIEVTSLQALKRKETQYRRLTESEEYRRARMVADAWCAAFFWRKRQDAPPAVTEALFRRLSESLEETQADVLEEIERLRQRYALFHWHLAFPDVFSMPKQGEQAENPEIGWSGGFDVVLGNPPWERVKLQEKEWFAGRDDEIAAAPNKAARGRLIQRLQDEDPALHAAFLDAKRGAEAESQFLRSSGRYPLCGRGDINTYAVFAELKRSLIGSWGQVGCIVPTGIATDDTTKFFFQDLMDRGALMSLHDFANSRGIFPIDRNSRFCLLSLTGSARPVQAADFVFFALGVDDLREADRHFSLSREEIALLNPNTHTCPIFRSKADAVLTKAIYRRVPVLFKEGPPEENPWGIRLMTMFHMSNDSHLFRTRDQLEAKGWRLEGNIFVRGDMRYLPLYEAKMIHQFDHRFAHSYMPTTGARIRGGSNKILSKEHEDPRNFALPRYWVPESQVDSHLNSVWNRDWMISWRGITGTVANERTVISSVIPKAGFGHSMSTITMSKNSILLSVIQGNLNAFILDYIARQKIGGLNLTYGYLNQFPILARSIFDAEAPWSRGISNFEWFLLRQLELSYTSWDLEPFANDCLYNGSPFIWNDERRFPLRCELDAAFFHLYLPSTHEGRWRRARVADGAMRNESDEELAELESHFPTPRHAVDCIVDTFPIVRRRDEAEYGEYRTKHVILEIYDAMQQAIETGEPYQTRLDPPPADPRVAHSSRDSA